MTSFFRALLAQPRFDSLNFADVGRLTEHEKAAALECMDAALAAFLSEIQFRHGFAKKDRELRDDLWSWSRENLAAVCVCEDKVLDRLLEDAADCVEYFFPCAHHDTRLQMAMGLAASLSIDDGVTSATSRKRLANFQYELWCGVPDSERDEWSKMYTKVIRNFVRYFGASDARMGTIGANGWANYVEASSLEESLSKSLPPHFSLVRPGTDGHGCCPDGFAYFFRILTGLPGPFILGMFKPSKDVQVPLEYWITSMAPLTTFINLINDLFSLPKELLAGETCNYMSLQTLARRQGGHPSAFPRQGDADTLWTFRDTICEAMDLLRDATGSLDRAFVQFHRVCPDDEKNKWKTALASQVWTAFRHGYLSWKVNSPRYGLASLRSSFIDDGGNH
ncbi:hypothetical protein Trco_002903 [Trichoderma cornu-damae]|uniref:Uncharacterized protein n=1 Tax=Trichoderma cornu-damae TaxID=654480 RepID=A0A9P8QVS1_9HYPO|nr:hypothetical protein Trco_002903 [Trichoderma cornu-damae]